MERERIFKRDKKGRKRKREVAQEKERAKEAGRKTQCYFFASNFTPPSFPLSFRPTISLFIDILAWDCFAAWRLLRQNKKQRLLPRL